MDQIGPRITDANRRFWEATALGTLQVQRCHACDYLRYPPAPWCPRCLSDRSGWEVLSGMGTIFSKLVFHQAYHPLWADRTPYNVVLVQLAEGPRMVSNIVPLSEEAFQVGDTVRVVFEHEGEFVVPRFTLAPQRASLS